MGLPREAEAHPARRPEDAAELHLEHAAPQGGAPADECLLSIPRWDFDWQRAYFYEQPITASLEDVMKVTCEWSTLEDEVPVRPGFGTGDEMCLVGLMVVPE